MDAICSRNGLSSARVRLVGLLHCGGPQTMHVLADALDVSPRNVTALVDGLEAEGFAEREPHPADRRAITVRLTPAGLDWARRHLVPIYEECSAPFRDMPEHDRTELARLLQTIWGSVQKTAGDLCGKAD